MKDLFAHYQALCQAEECLSGISFELTNLCNFRCAHCYRIHGNQFLDISLFNKVLGEAEALGTIMVSFNGGEPTLHPGFLDFSLSVLRRGMQLNVLTNASCLTDEMLDVLTPWHLGVHFQVSLYGTDPASGVAITGFPGSFEATWSKILNLKSRGFDLRVSLLAVESTADALPELVQKLRAQNLRLGLMPQLSVVEDGSNVPLSLRAKDPQLLPLFEYEGNWDQEDPYESTTNLRTKNDRLACNAGVTSLGIRADGSIVPCLICRSPILGNVSSDSLASVLSGEARRQFLEANVIPDTCRSCDLRRFCMRCPADACFETGSLTGIPPESCRIARLRAKFHIDSPK